MAVEGTRPVGQQSPVMEDKGFIERGAIRFVNWSRNTVIEGKEHELRGILYKTAVAVISIVIVLFNFIVFLPGWAFLYYARQEHDRQVVAEQIAGETTSNKITTLENRVHQLEDEQKTATAQLTLTVSQRADALKNANEEKAALQTKFNNLKSTCDYYCTLFNTIVGNSHGNTGKSVKKYVTEFQADISKAS